MKLLEKNQSKNERVIRFIIGLILVIPFFTHGYTFSYILLGIGSILIFNALSGVCMIYKMLGHSTCKIE
ncbi:MAG: DUF2892 domain-containing protein [Crocinitomicaceae bacterium TMED135]|nr:MAG: hypothetical protein CND37_02350 [Bacteroidetes bacterium MED-G20]RPG80953.1 MAG: DUF2892 domain-containing protein [Crocinitomicaceae bacterium TMED135]